MDYLKIWNTIDNIYPYDLKKMDSNLIELSLAAELKSYLPNSLLLEKSNPEIVGIFKLFLLPNMNILYKIKVITKSKKSVFEKNMMILKYELKVLFGVKLSNETPEIFRKDKEFLQNCLKIIFCNMFGPFYAESKRLLENRLETLKEEDEAMWETTKLK